MSNLPVSCHMILLQMEFFTAFTERAILKRKGYREVWEFRTVFGGFKVGGLGDHGVLVEFKGFTCCRGTVFCNW